MLFAIFSLDDFATIQSRPSLKNKRKSINLSVLNAYEKLKRDNPALEKFLYTPCLQSPMYKFLYRPLSAIPITMDTFL